CAGARWSRWSRWPSHRRAWPSGGPARPPAAPRPSSVEYGRQVRPQPKQGTAHEVARTQAGVGDLKAGLVHLLVAEQQDVDVDLAGAPAIGLGASDRVLDDLRRSQQLGRGPLP